MPNPAELNVPELAALLAAEGHDLSDEQIAAIAQFLRQVGSVEKAQQAVEALGQIRKAA